MSQRSFVQQFRDAVGEDAWLSIPPYLQNWIMAKALATHRAFSDEGSGIGELREAASLVFRIEAAGPIECEADNFARWKATAREIAPRLRTALSQSS